MLDGAGVTAGVVGVLLVAQLATSSAHSRTIPRRRMVAGQGVKPIRFPSAQQYYTKKAAHDERGAARSRQNRAFGTYRFVWA